MVGETRYCEPSGRQGGRANPLRASQGKAAQRCRTVRTTAAIVSPCTRIETTTTQ
jgi:hypothetical protein